MMSNTYSTKNWRVNPGAHESYAVPKTHAMLLRKPDVLDTTCSQTNTNNINKAWILLQTNGNKDKPNNSILFYKNFPFLSRVVGTIFQQIVVIPTEIKYTPSLVPLIYKAI